MLLLRLLAAIFAVGLLVHAALEGLEYLHAHAAYALAGWLTSATISTSSGFVTVALWFAVLSWWRRSRAPRSMLCEDGWWWWLDAKGTRTRAFSSGQVLRVRPMPGIALLLLAVLPGCPACWRPLSGTLRGWLAVRVKGRGWCFLPCDLPVASGVALQQGGRGAAPAMAPALRPAFAPAAWRAAAVVIAVPLATIANVLADPPLQGWISAVPARLALATLATAEMNANQRTELLRSAVAAGNPAVVSLLLEALGPEAAVVDARRLTRSDCMWSLSELATLDAPPAGITPAQRAIRAAALGDVLRPFERRARSTLASREGRSEELVSLALDARRADRCPDRPPPYWQGEWTVHALWPKDAQGRPQTPHAFLLGFGYAADAFRLALEVGALDPRQPVTVLEQTPLMLTLVALREQRAREAKDRDPAVEADLRSAVEVLVQGARSDLQARDAAGRSVAWLAAAAGEGALMRRALAEGSSAALAGRTAAGSTLLHAAAIGGLVDEMRWLRERGLAPDAVDHEGRTPGQPTKRPDVGLALSR